MQIQSLSIRSYNHPLPMVGSIHGGKQKTIHARSSPHQLQALGTISFDSTKSISFVGKISEGIENGLRSFPNVLLPTISINSSSMLGFPAEHSQNSFDSCISISHFKISPKCTNPYLPKPANPDCKTHFLSVHHN